MQIKTFSKLDELGIKNAFVGGFIDFSNDNQNRKKEISKILNVNEDKVFCCVQNHTNNIASNPFSNLKNCDGIITNEKGVTLFTYIADCLGILLYDSNKKVIGCVHAGWRGSFNGVIINAINIMVNEYNCNKKDILCFFSPSIRACHFEVEKDVLEYAGIDLSEFIVKKQKKNGVLKYNIDLVLFNKKMLLKEGILLENIYDMNECTVCNNYFSYRKNKTKKRNGLIISL